MNVFEKLAEARVRFQNENIKMSGKNSFANYEYYELADILPVTNRICKDLKAVCVVRYSKEEANLDFIDCEKPEDQITFTTPMSEANLKGCHPVQNLGAAQTYIKRYLYQACFEIVEKDELDNTMNPNEKNQRQTEKRPAQQQQQIQLKGGPSTPEEVAKIRNLLESKYADGTPVFTKEEKLTYSNYRKEKYTAKELITFIENALKNRLPQTAEPAEFKEDIPWEEPAPQPGFDIV